MARLLFRICDCGTDIRLCPSAINQPESTTLETKYFHFWQPAAGVAELLLGVGGQYLNAKP